MSTVYYESLSYVQVDSYFHHFMYINFTPYQQNPVPGHMVPLAQAAFVTGQAGNKRKKRLRVNNLQKEAYISKNNLVHSMLNRH